MRRNVSVPSAKPVSSFKCTRRFCILRPNASKNRVSRHTKCDTGIQVKRTHMITKKQSNNIKVRCDIILCKETTLL